ncbi:hypothetical protein NFI88_00485 [Acetobacteraceae bacterium KSS12]|uniref:Glycine zipper 2TM domain-containing protein n=2 Tax=Rhizosaccharibacter radicis TaxID=2782605 RepID=A0ABT1VT11_9PROT|nr:hypothetical protein [Acetobacteraceae bacterium KSS12]
MAASSSRTVLSRGRCLLASAALLCGLAPALPAAAEPGGCLKYGAAGAVGGHLAHHGVLGAAGGCATGMYVRHRYRKQQRQDAKDAAAYRRGETNPNAAPDANMPAATDAPH